MSDQDYRATPKTFSPALKPAAIGVLMAGTAGLYAIVQTGPARAPHAVSDPAKISAASVADANSNTAAARPQFGHAPATEVEHERSTAFADSRSPASGLTANAVQQEVALRHSTAVPEIREVALSKPVLSSGRQPLQQPALAVPASIEPGTSIDESFQPKVALSTAPSPVPAPVAIEEPKPSFALADPAPAPAQVQPDPAPVSIPSSAASVAPIAQAPATPSGAVQSFAGSSISPTGQIRISSLGTIETGEQAYSLAPPASNSLVATSLAATRAIRTTAQAAPSSKPVQLSAGLARPTGAARLSGHQPGSAHANLDGYRMIGDVIEFKMPVRINGEQLGKLTMHVAPDDGVSLKLMELVSMFQDQLDPQLVSALKSSPTIDEFVTFDRIRAAGINVAYDAVNNQVTLAASPD